ncbi:ABC-F family ATP-binding cassette domain-containing protein [Streptomyces piniterrae]|uniref:ABC-F family ATP-binding cassette domain-containing protein n=1 Tax=Streptomyces piniterrae TaxID=2571125 RepID=A0A4U0NSN1_9ACTN|nr:ABC-F family ATP-binding cassette domain-containing protein [Streptomyces piniterrae]
MRAGARLLLSDISFTISPGDRIGLVGRNGAGKTTLMTALAGQAEPDAGTITRTGPVGFLAQDSRAADPTVTVTDRILSARGLDRALRALRTAEAAMAHATGPAELERAMNRYTHAEAAFQAGGGYAAEAEAARVAAGLGLPDRVLGEPVGALSGGQRRRVELARILFAGHSGTLLLDEPTNHLDADSIAWLRTFLRSHPGGLMLISHDTSLLADVVNRVFHLDTSPSSPLLPQSLNSVRAGGTPMRRGATDRTTIEVHNTGWRAYLAQREYDERRRARERANAERKAAALHAQADKMKARVATAVTARNMARRADRMLADLEPARRTEKTARIRLPEPAPCGRMPLGAISLAKSYGGHQVLSGVDLAVDRGSRVVVLGLNGAGKTTLLRILAGAEDPDSGRVVRGHGLRLGYFAQEHDTLDTARTVRQNLAAAAPHLTDGEARRVLGAFLFSGDDADKPAAVLSGGEKTRLALAGLVHSGANVLLLDEPTNHLDPAPRDEVLAAVGSYPGAIVMVTHDGGAVDALRPDRVLLLPDADEDLWNEEYRDLVSLA